MLWSLRAPQRDWLPSSIAAETEVQDVYVAELIDTRAEALNCMRVASENECQEEPLGE